jgi:hypothetical protein
LNPIDMYTSASNVALAALVVLAVVILAFADLLATG